MEQKSVMNTIDLPTGVKLDSGEVVKHLIFREMAGPEEDVLASNLQASQKITQILANCVLELGPIKDPISAKRYISKLTVSDRWFYLVKLRALSLGSEYKFEVRCPSCEKTDKQSVNLDESSVRNAPEAAALFHEVVLPSGKKVRWRVLDGEGEAKLQKLSKPENAPTMAIFVRIAEIDDKPATVSDVTHLSMRDRNFLRKEFEEKEGDFDDTFQTTCPHCGHEYEGDLSLDAKAFFFP